MSALLKDIKFGLHLLAKYPGSTAAALLALALGIGANSAIFCVMNAILLRPLPFHEPDRLMEIRALDPHGGDDLVSPADFLDWKSQNRAFTDLAGFQVQGVILTGKGEPLSLAGVSVTPNLFKVLGTQAAVGRTFVDGPPGTVDEHEIVLGYGLWQREFGADPKVVGQKLQMNDQTYVVVGIAPRELPFPREAQVFVRGQYGFPVPPAAIKGDPSTVRRIQYFEVLGRLRPGVSRRQAEVEMVTIQKRLAERYQEADAGRSARVMTFSERLFGNIRPALVIIFAACGFVLLIACANVASLLLARIAVRAREIAVRSVLGAQRGRLTRQILSESVVMTVFGGALGSLLAIWGTKLLVGLSPVRVARLDEVHVDARVLLFTLLLSVVTGTLVGVLPALQATRSQLQLSLNESGTKSTSSLRRRRAQSFLVASEVAIALVLLVGAGLLIKSLLSLRALNPGYNPSHVLTVQVNLPRSKYSKPQPVFTFFSDLLSRVQQLPGVISVAAADDLLPAGPAASLAFEVEGRPKARPGEKTEAFFHTVTPGYFRTLEIPLLSGRDFDARDVRGATDVVIVNRTLAERFWPGQDPIGKRISFGSSNGQPDWVSVIGVAENVRYNGLTKSTGFDVFSSFLQSRANSMGLLVRTSRDPLLLARPVKSQILAIDRDQPVSGVSTLEQLLADSISDERFLAFVLAILATLALVLAMIGIYAVMSFSVAQRSHEVGIRVALGARRQDVLRLIIREAALLALAGVGVGFVASLGFNRVLANRLFGVSTTDPAVFVTLAAVLMAVSLVASYVPARRAMNVDPNAVLK